MGSSTARRAGPAAARRAAGVTARRPTTSRRSNPARTRLGRGVPSLLVGKPALRQELPGGGDQPRRAPVLCKMCGKGGDTSPKRRRGAPRWRLGLVSPPFPQLSRRTVSCLHGHLQVSQPGVGVPRYLDLAEQLGTAASRVQEGSLLGRPPLFQGGEVEAAREPPARRRPPHRCRCSGPRRRASPSPTRRPTAGRHPSVCWDECQPLRHPLPEAA